MENIKRRNGDENARLNKPRFAKLRKRVKWTVMVYLAGDNNLTPNCITVLQQLEAVKYSEDVRVLACFDSNTPWPKGSRYLAINGKWFPNDEELDWEIYNDLIITSERGESPIKPPDFCLEDGEVKGVPMTRTDPAVGLKRFLKWAMGQGPSDHYMLVLYGHGPVVAGKTFLVRENPASSLSMTDIPKLLGHHFGKDKGQKLDILAFQNCAMNGIETAYEVRDQVDYMIGSQGLVLSYGWPYDKIIQALVDNQEGTPLEICEEVLKKCARHLIDFSVMDRSSEQSVCDLSKLRDADDKSVARSMRRDREKKSNAIPENLTEAITDLGTVLKAALLARVDRVLQGKPQNVLKYPIICDAVRLARLEAQSYWGETFVDVYDFCERLLKKSNEAILAQNDLANDLERALNVEGNLEKKVGATDVVSRLSTIVGCCTNVMNRVEEMVRHSYYIGPDLQYSHGLSIYFPWTMQGEPYSFRQEGQDHVLVTAFETYSGYGFVKTSEWADFLKAFYKATLRNVRRSPRTFRRRPASADLSGGIVSEAYTQPGSVLATEYLQKTDSDHGSVDYDVWSNVKNYPRRNYLSPSDCKRKIEITGCHRPESFQDRDWPPVSYLGWNICKFVDNVIRQNSANGNNCNNGEHKRG